MLVKNEILRSFFQAATALVCIILFPLNDADGVSLLKLPSKESKFDGLYGIKIKKGIRCPKCCDLVFPEKFGLGNMGELTFLKEIVNQRPGLEHDLNCVTGFWSYDTLDHFKYLATVQQDKAAARMLLTPGVFDLGGGELDEVYPDQYIRPVVEKYKKLSELLNVKVISYIADELCSAFFNPVIESDLDLTKLVSDLKKRNLDGLANKIESTCKKFESQFQ